MFSPATSSRVHPQFVDEPSQYDDTANKQAEPTGWNSDKLPGTKVSERLT